MGRIQYNHKSLCKPEINWKVGERDRLEDALPVALREEEGARSPSMQSASRNRTSHRDSKENAVCCRFDCALVSPVEDT